MPRAEAGTPKAVAAKINSNRLKRLRWYCQACEKGMQDENGFKCHVASESHVRNMQAIIANPQKAEASFSQQFQRDFLTLLRTGHGEKKVHLNNFYQELIRDKNHIHMSATKWKSLTEFAKHLGREGICRVYDEEEKGLHISWIDNSPDALRRQEALRKRERQDKGDEEREQKDIREQIERANKARIEAAAPSAEDEAKSELVREEGKKISLSFGAKKAPASQPEPTAAEDKSSGSEKEGATDTSEEKAESKPVVKAAPVSLSFKSAAAPKKENVFALSNKSAKRKKPADDEVKAPMSNAQRIMMEEQAKRKRVF